MNSLQYFGKLSFKTESVTGHFRKCLVPILTWFYSFCFCCHVNHNSAWNGNLCIILKVDNAKIIHKKFGESPPSGLGDVKDIC